MKTILSAVGVLLLTSGCSMTIPLSYKSAFIGAETRKLSPAIDGSAVVYMGASDEKLVVSQKPSSFTGSFGTVQVPLNGYVKEVFTATFDRFCRSGAESSDSTSGLKAGQLLIKPVVETFDYKMNMPFTLNVENAIQIFVKLRVHVVIEQGDGKTILDKSFGGDRYTEYGGAQLKGEPDMLNKAFTLEVLNCALTTAQELKDTLAKTGAH